MSQYTLLRTFQGQPRPFRATNNTFRQDSLINFLKRFPDSLIDFLEYLPNEQNLATIRYLPIIPHSILFLQGLENGKDTSEDHIIDKSMFNNLHDTLRQGITYQNEYRNLLTVPRRLNAIKGIIQQVSQDLTNTTVFVSWGADNDATTTNDIYLIVRMELRPARHNSAQNYSFILLDPPTWRQEEDQVDYIATIKKIIKDFDTNTLSQRSLPLPPPPA